MKITITLESKDISVATNTRSFDDSTIADATFWHLVEELHSIEEENEDSAEFLEAWEDEIKTYIKELGRKA